MSTTVHVCGVPFEVRALGSADADGMHDMWAVVHNNQVLCLSRSPDLWMADLAPYIQEHGTAPPRSWIVNRVLYNEQPDNQK